MDVRSVLKSELEETIHLNCLVFRPDGHTRYRQYVEDDCSYQLDQTRVVVVDKRVVATLRIWERRMRIGSSIVTMGGIGGVCTHPDYRGLGYATELMKNAVEYMQNANYDIGVLFSIIPGKFYSNLGWAPLILEGFQIVPHHVGTFEDTNWRVEKFDEARDLNQVATLYDEYNLCHSGTIVRPRSYWNMAPSRIRDVLPSIVVRHKDMLSGYLNFHIEDKKARILEVAFDREDPTSLSTLVMYLLNICDQQQVEKIYGSIPYQHPLVDLVVEGCAGDLFLIGDSSMMLYVVNLLSLLRKLLPELQSRIDASENQLQPVSIRIETRDQQAVLRLHDSGILQIFDLDEEAVCVKLPDRFFWRMLLGEASWDQLEPTLKVHGFSVPQEVSTLFSVLFPQKIVVFWGPDHY
ncbi:hypothetical protein CMK22_19350 [Candidatus Poribacteria bacterium]|nr:hypothetical protein [Candidatus Poribacteria bacterium]